MEKTERNLMNELVKVRKSRTAIKKEIVKYFNNTPTNAKRECKNIYLYDGLDFPGGDTFHRYELEKDGEITGSGRLNFQSTKGGVYLSRLMLRCWNSEDKYYDEMGIV